MKKIDKSMRILLHFHPHATFWVRSILEPKSLFGFKLKDIELYVISGGNFLSGYESEVQKILGLRGLFKDIKIIQLPFEIRYFENKGFDWLNSGASKLSLFDDESYLLENSVKDSLYRGISNVVDTLRLYTSINDSYFEMSNCARRNYAYALLEYYTRLIEEIKPNYVAISHGNYDYYISLYLAARVSNIPVQLVHGGHNRSYFIFNKKELTDHAPTSEHIRILKGLLNKTIDSKILEDYADYVKSKPWKSINMKRLQGSASEILAKYILDCQNNSGGVLYLLMMPILGETTHQDAFAKLKFKSKLEWIENLFREISECEYESKLLIRMHPSCSFYGEERVVQQYLHITAKKYNIEIKIIDSLKDIEHSLGEAKQHDYQIRVLTFGSTLTAELADLNVRSSTANECLASQIEGATFSEEAYFESKVKLERMNFELKAVNLQAEKRCMDILHRWLSANSKKNAVDRVYRNRIDLHCFFGRNTPFRIDKREVVNTFIDYDKSVQFKSFFSEDNAHFFPWVN